MEYDDTASCCALNRIFGFKPRIALAMIKEVGKPSEVFRLGKKELDCILGPFSPYKAEISDTAYGMACREIEELQKNKICFLPCYSDSYPQLLKECPDQPIGLYIKSISTPEEIFNGKRFISVVGTRDISEYGKEWCKKSVRAIASSDSRPVIVSGLAVGTDITAHRKALDTGLPTIAVMATGIDKIYPSTHRHDAEKIAGTAGCALITDYPPGTSPLKINFLRRNRIIAGISDSTILIESHSKGGGMLTARLAFSYSRDVYALPGRAGDCKSEGCNILIRENTAEALISEESLIKSLGMKYIAHAPEYAPINTARKIYNNSSRLETLAEILRTIHRKQGIGIEELAEETGIGYKEILEYTAMLETDGLIKTDLAQRCYIRTK